MVKNNISINKGMWASLAAVRLMIGFVFLWAFLDKTFGLGVSTSSEQSWLSGGSPTTGYLGSLDGTFGSFFNNLAGNAVVDWLFMLGLLGIGVGLILGIAMRISIISGIAMMMLMWLAALPIATNPLVDDHLVYATVLMFMWFSLSLQRISIGHIWRSLPVVSGSYWLR